MTQLYLMPLPSARAFPREVVETQALFLLRTAVTMGAQSPTMGRALDQLARSQNAAVANEARRLAAVCQ